MPASMSSAATRAPSRANIPAATAPMPFAAPVTTTTRPSNRTSRSPPRSGFRLDRLEERPDLLDVVRAQHLPPRRHAFRRPARADRDVKDLAATIAIPPLEPSQIPRRLRTLRVRRMAVRAMLVEYLPACRDGLGVAVGGIGDHRDRYGHGRRPWAGQRLPRDPRRGPSRLQRNRRRLGEPVPIRESADLGSERDHRALDALLERAVALAHGHRGLPRESRARDGHDT